MKLTNLVVGVFFTSLIVLSAVPVLALNVPNQTNGGTSGNQNGGTSGGTSINANIPNPLKGGGNLVDLFNSIIDSVILPLGAILAVLAFIWSGFLFVTAQGNETQLKKAKAALLYTAVGTAVLLGARVLGAVVENTIKTIAG